MPTVGTIAENLKMYSKLVNNVNLTTQISEQHVRANLDFERLS